MTQGDEYGIEGSTPAFKVIVIGDVSVGKTSLISRSSEGVFRENHGSSLGVDFKMKELQLDQRTIKLQLWDFSGDVQNRFANVAKHAYTEAHGIVIVFDITNKESFDDLESHWLGELNQQTLRPNHVKILVGNKSDLVERRAVKDAQSLATKYACEYVETSAKRGDGVDELFLKVGKAIHTAWQNGGYKEAAWTEDEKKKKKCCLQ